MFCVLFCPTSPVRQVGPLKRNVVPTKLPHLKQRSAVITSTAQQPAELTNIPFLVLSCQPFTFSLVWLFLFIYFEEMQAVRGEPGAVLIFHPTLCCNLTKPNLSARFVIFTLAGVASVLPAFLSSKHAVRFCIQVSGCRRCRKVQK